MVKKKGRLAKQPAASCVHLERFCTNKSLHTKIGTVAGKVLHKQTFSNRKFANWQRSQFLMFIWKNNAHIGEQINADRYLCRVKHAYLQHPYLQDRQTQIVGSVFLRKVRVSGGRVKQLSVKESCSTQIAPQIRGR